MSKILIIDDSSQMSHLLKEMVTIFGHTAEIAHSGSEGIEKVQSFEPELILLDIMMPGMDGWGFYEAHKQTSEVPVIMISADASFATRKKAEEIGVMLLEKGVEPFLLRDIISDATTGAAQSS
ncbi:MAG: response regulator [Chloroflexota bacterium]